MAEAKKDNTTTYIIVGGVLVLVIWDKIFGKSEEEKKVEVEEKKLEETPPEKNPTNANYNLGAKPPKNEIPFRSTKTIPAVPADYFSKAVVALKLAIGTFSDDEAAIMAALKRAVTKGEMALMVKAYNQVFKQDLFTVLKDNLSAKEMLPIYTYVNKLPNFIKGKFVK